jgi:hypothetical protein
MAAKRNRKVAPKGAPREPVDRVIPSEARRCVTIFGGGIAGLTAAQELVERRFTVQVWEPKTDARRPDAGCDIGGMARTQWCGAPWPVKQKFEGIPEWKERRSQNIKYVPHVFYVGETKKVSLAFGLNGQMGVKAAVKQLIDFIHDDPEIEYLYSEVQYRRQSQTAFAAIESKALEENKGGAPPDVFFLNLLEPFYQFVDEEMATNVEISKLELDPDYKWHAKATITFTDQPGRSAHAATEASRNGKNDKKSARGERSKQRLADGKTPGHREVVVGVALLDGFPDGVPAEYTTRFSFRTRQHWLPGEHGFRVFPGFYSHVFDTMKRTPILGSTPKSTVGAAQERSVTVNASRDKYVETGRTAYDNIRSTTKIILGLRAQRDREGRARAPGPFVGSLFAPASLEDVRKWLGAFFGKTNPTAGLDEPQGFGVTSRDMARCQVQILKYMTSCDARRKEYEHMTWMEFLGGQEAFSEEFIEMMNEWPEALIAMDAKTVDARSQGSALIQFLLDGVRPAGFREGTLVGPTNEAWLDPWRLYLEAQGVEFIHGELKGFTKLSSDEGTVVWPEVACYEPRYLQEDGHPYLMPGYFVLALPVEEARAMAKAYVDLRPSLKKAGVLGDLAQLDAFEIPTGKSLNKPRPDGPLRHMVGIQYYFDEEIAWFDGHGYFPNSEWGLTAISQVRFWQDRPDWEHGYRGVLSVIFSLTKEGNPDTAWTSPPPDIAKRVWAQIKESFPNAPEPRYWHLDDNFQYDPKSGGYVNASPYLINLPGGWDGRPGRLRTDPTEPDPGYAVEDGIVLAGTHMKTHMRLTTMEAANESARHAVNGILAVEDFARDAWCEIFPLEDREVDDFMILKELDAELYSRGLDHFVDVLNLPELSSHLLRGGRKDPFDGLGVLGLVGDLLQRYGGEAISAIANEVKKGAGR